MDVSITALNKAERRLEIVLAGAPEPPEAFTVVHGDTALARSTAIVSGQAPGGGLSISCEVLADVAAEMVLPAFSTARYGARFPGVRRSKPPSPPTASRSSKNSRRSASSGRGTI